MQDLRGLRVFESYRVRAFMVPGTAQWLVFWAWGCRGRDLRPVLLVGLSLSQDTPSQEMV